MPAFFKMNLGELGEAKGITRNNRRSSGTGQDRSKNGYTRQNRSSLVEWVSEY